MLQQPAGPINCQQLYFSEDELAIV